MPTVVIRTANKLETKGCFEWSWPGHPPEMTDGEARIRVPRNQEPVRGRRRTANLDTEALATEYGKLLEEGNARVQQSTPAGDNLPRNARGELLGIKQEFATDVAEVRNDWSAEVYDTEGAVVERPGDAPEERWGATNELGMATWLPGSDERNQQDAVATARALEGATDSRAAADIAWCANLKTNDDGDIWREAVARGRSVEGKPADIITCSERAPQELEISREKHRDNYEAEADGPHRIVLHVPDHDRTGIAKEADELYAAARGSLCTEYGPPLTREEKALDALAASIVTSRGTNGAGAGWTPREPELLVEAGRELQRNPDRLEDLVKQVETVERNLYPPWPSRDRMLEQERAPEPEEDPDTFDRDRLRYYRDVRLWGELQQRDRERERKPGRQPDRQPPTRERRTPHPEVPQREPVRLPPGVKLPGKDEHEVRLPGYNPDEHRDKLPRKPARNKPEPEADEKAPAPKRPPTPPAPEPPAPERAPSPTRETPREPDHDRGPSR